RFKIPGILRRRCSLARLSDSFAIIMLNFACIPVGVRMNFSFALRRAVLTSTFLIFLAAVPAPLASAQTAATPPRRPASAIPARPKLVVLLVVDQMRADYVDKFLPQWKGGLRRLVEQGAWFHDAAYPYATTETCVGHSTISTGSFPTTHGMIANAWFDRE